jgi:thiol:disulfide interchange protein DsbD
MRRRLALAIPLAAPLLALAAASAGPPPGDAGLVSVELRSDAAHVGPGQKFHLAVVFTIQPKWHIYWKDPGEGALAPTLTVQAPPGFEVGSPLWPRPVAVEGPIGREFCYFDEVVLFVPITAPAALGEGTAELNAEIRWAVCKEICRLGSARKSLTIATVPSPVNSPPTDALLARWWKRLPAPLADLPDATVAFNGRTLLLAGPAGNRTSAAFLSASTPGLTLAEPQVAVNKDRFRVSVEVRVDPRNALGPMALRGLVALGEGPDDPCYDFEVPVQADQPGEPGWPQGGKGP